MTDTEVVKRAEAAILKHGYVGLDLNMAAMCICARRSGITLHRHSQRPGARNYAGFLDYWARKREFGHLRCGTEQEVVEAAIEDYEKSN